MKYIFSIGLITLLFMCSCSNSSSNNHSSKPNKQISKPNKQKSINGVYYYSDSSAESSITISGNSWFGKLVIKSGFGASYDDSNASYTSGIVKDGILYDDSGYIELGSVNGTSLSIPVGSRRVTHYK